MAAAKAISKLLDLSVQDRIELVQVLWDSIAQEADSIPVPDSHLKEVRRRLEACRQNPAAGSSWPEVRERIRANK